MTMSNSEIVSIPEREEPRDPDDYTGRTIDGYTLGEKLGEGGIGVVYSAEKERKELKAEQTQNVQEANFPIYKKYIQILKDINPRKITDELADNIAYSAWKEGLKPEYVDYIVESIARRREKGLVSRIKEGLFGNKDAYSGKSKQEIREKIRKHAQSINDPAWSNPTIKNIKKAGRNHNVFVDDIIEDVVRGLAEKLAHEALVMPGDGTHNGNFRRTRQLETMVRYAHRAICPPARRIC